MAWTNITNAQLAVGAPIRSVDLLALRDNIVAAQNGDAGAPQQQTAGIADNAVTAAKVNKGNGIGTSGTQLVVACPAFNSVGSYAQTIMKADGTTNNAGSNYSAGSGNNQVQATSLRCSTALALKEDPTQQVGINTTNSLSGTWKWMSATTYLYEYTLGLSCRVS